MNHFAPIKTVPILWFVLLCLTLVFTSITVFPVIQAQPLAQAATLPEDTRLPYEGTKFYTGGPHTGGICQKVKIADSSGIDFAGGTFEVLSIADGKFVTKGEQFSVDKNGKPILSPGKYVLIEHATEIQSMYWHLASFSPEIEVLIPDAWIPRGFPIGMSGNTGQLGGPVHLHLELRRDGTAANPFGKRESWDGKTIQGWTINMFRWPGDPSTGISYRGSAVKGASRIQSITNVTCSQTTADAIVSESYPNQTIASNDLDSNTGFANFSNARTCQAVDCKSLISRNTRNTNLSTEDNPVDVFLLVDLSESFSDDLPIFKVQAPEIINSLKSSNPNIRFGLGSFEDYPISPFGVAGSGDAAYRRNIDLTFDTAAVEAVIGGLFTRSGGDDPESQLSALFQAATGAGQDLSGVGFPEASIPPGQQANFRDGATKLFLLWTDAPFHQPGDPGVIPYPGPSFEETVEAIQALDPPKVIGISSGGGGIADLEIIAANTGALAPAGGVDCNHDGIIDILAGNPLVCSIGVSGEGIAEATTALIEAVAEPQAPEIVRVETFREGVLVFFRLFFTDPSDDAVGFGFRLPAFGEGEENHLFASPSFGRVSPGKVEYPFNLGCSTESEHEIGLDAEAWIFDSAGVRSPSVTVHLACSAPSSLSFNVGSTSGWQPTTLKVTQGQPLSFSAVGAWTVDYRNFSYVGPEGYSSEEDSQIYQGCKLDPLLPYGTLLARIGDNLSFWVVGRGGTFTADSSGALAFRIHDSDGCLGDNTGSVQVTVTYDQ
jgi:hypothetical protein